MKRQNKLNMSRENQPPPPPLQVPPPPPTQRPPLHSQQGPPILMGGPYQWFLLPPPPPPREPTPPAQTYPGPAVPASSYTSRIDTSKPPPPLPQQVKNGTIRRLPEEEGVHPKAQSTYSASRPVPEMLPNHIVDTTQPPPRLPTAKSNSEKRALPDSNVGPCKTRKIDTETTTCENCLQWDLRNLELEKRKKEKLKEKGILVLRCEEKKKEIGDILDTLKGLHTSNNEAYDLASLDLRYALNDPDIISLQRTKNSDGPDFSQLSKANARNILDTAGSSTKDSIRNGKGPTIGLPVTSGEMPRSFSTQSQPPPVPPQFNVPTSGASSSAVTYSHPPPIPPQNSMGQSQNSMGQSQNSMGQSQNSMGQSHNSMGQSQNSMGQSQNSMGQSQNSMGQSYRPPNNQFYPYFPGPSNSDSNSKANNAANPPTSVMPPYDQNMYYNMMGRPPPPFP